MDILNIIGSIASIASLFISLFVATKINNIGKQIKADNKGIAAGRDVKINKG